MSGDIFGALFASVSGIDTQSTNLSIIANNISNANTDGYKAAQVEFETLVSGSSSNANYASGGVLADNRQLVDQQGLLQSTGSPTDIAIQGGGLFVVNSSSDGSGQVLYTRAGSFTQDSSGNFVNAAGYYLQAWPLNSSGLLPGAPGNTTDVTSSADLSSLQTVNVESVAGKASPTTSVSLVANLNAAQTAYPGAAGVATMDKSDATNYGVSADELILPTTTDNITPDVDQMKITTGQNATGYTYLYGGIATSRDALTGAGGGLGAVQAAADLTPRSGGGNTAAFTFNSANLNGSGDLTSMTINNVNPATAGIQVGTVVALSGTGAAGGLGVNNVTSLDGNYYVTAINQSGSTITVAIPSSVTPPSTMTLTGATVATTMGQKTVTLTNIPEVPTGLEDGDTVTFAGLPATGGLTTGEINGTWVVSGVTTGANGSLTFTTTGPNAGSTTSNSVISADDASMFDNDGNLADTNTATVSSRLFTGNILDATSPTEQLITDPSDFTNAALSFTITSGSINATFTYAAASPIAENGQFNTLDNLATAISDVSGLSARVDATTGKLYVSATDGNNAIVFADGTKTGSNTSPPLAGIDWVQELGLADVSAYTGSDAGRFSSMQGLANLVNSSTGLSAAVAIDSSTGNEALTMNVNDPLDTITFSDASTNTGSLVAELGLTPTLGTGTVPLTTGPIGPIYSPTTSASNMASGAIEPQFSRTITVYDSLGESHTLNLAFINTGTNSWATEIYAEPSSDVTSSLPNGLIAYGTLNFNGDGSLKSISSLLSEAIPIDWTDGASASSIKVDWGTAGPLGTGLSNGMSQFAAPSNITTAQPNGAAVGAVTAISIGTTGIITASFSNGETQNLYQIPLGTFADPDDLSSESGNVYGQTATSGQVDLQVAGSSGSAGTIASSSLEQSNVELADQLTDMIVAQRAYEANTKVISTADTLLSDLDQIIQ